MKAITTASRSSNRIPAYLIARFVEKAKAKLNEAKPEGPDESPCFEVGFCETPVGFSDSPMGTSEEYVAFSDYPIGNPEEFGY